MLRSFTRMLHTTPLAGLSARTLQYLEPEALITILRDKGNDGKTVVVDVREEGFEERRIRGALSVKDSVFDKEVGRVAEQLKGADQVVLHCAHSIKRGPRCAGKLLEHLEAQGKDKPKVLVLKGGYDNFFKVHGSSKDLFTTPSN